MTFINKNNNNKKKERDKQTNTFQVSSICFQILLAVVCVFYGRRQRLSKHTNSDGKGRETYRTKVTTKNQPKYNLGCWRSALLSGGGEKNERSFIFLSALKTADRQHGRLAQVKTTLKSGGAFY